MDINFKYEGAETPDQIVFEQIWGEKPGGGLLANPSWDLKPGVALSLSSGKYVPMKAYRLLKEVKTTDTTIEIEKGSGIESGDVIGNKGLAVASTAVDTTTNTDKDVVTVTLGVAIPAGTVLYEAASAGATGSVPAATPAYILGSNAYADKGDQMVKLVNGANLRKETALVAPEVVALMKNINLV